MSARNRKQIQVRCAICGELFTPTKPGQRACGWRHARTLAGLTLSQRPVPSALVRQQAQNRLQRKRQIEAWCRDRWRDMSVREIEIFNFAVKVGYDRGYSRGYNARKRAAITRARRSQLQAAS